LNGRSDTRIFFRVSFKCLSQIPPSPSIASLQEAHGTILLVEIFRSLSYGKLVENPFKTSLSYARRTTSHSASIPATQPLPAGAVSGWASFHICGELHLPSWIAGLRIRGCFLRTIAYRHRKDFGFSCPASLTNVVVPPAIKMRDRDVKCLFSKGRPSFFERETGRLMPSVHRSTITDRMTSQLSHFSQVNAWKTSMPSPHRLLLSGVRKISTLAQFCLSAQSIALEWISLDPSKLCAVFRFYKFSPYLW
jgi:hypothetical protein